MYYLTDCPYGQYHIWEMDKYLVNARVKAGILSKQLGVPIYVMMGGGVVLVVYVVCEYTPKQTLMLEQLDILRKKYEKCLWWYSETGDGEVECLLAFLILLFIGIAGLWWIDAWVGK